MGEYAMYGGERTKIGTCEDLYYLRYDQRHSVQPLEGNINPASEDEQKTIRFRFPFPDEDDATPGSFENYNRYVPVDGIKPPADLDHHSVQFTSQVGYLVSIPCPEGSAKTEFRVHKNGWRGDVLLTQQAIRGGVLAPIFMCGGCGAKWSEPDAAKVAPPSRDCLKRPSGEAVPISLPSGMSKLPNGSRPVTWSRSSLLSPPR